MNAEVPTGKVARPLSIKFVDPNALALIGSLLAIDLAQGLDLEEQNVLGNFIIDVGQILLTMAAAKEAQLKAAEVKSAEIKAQEEQAKKTETKKEQGTPTQTEGAQTQPDASDQSDVDVDEFIGRDRKTLEQRLESLERQVRQLAAARKN